jgi:UDP-2-acetamido-2,6-beta-L-arabino-hexul-4-ose reductase
LIKVGITGQAEFIGTHLFNFFGLKKDEVVRIPFEDRFFKDNLQLEEFVKKCNIMILLSVLDHHKPIKLCGNFYHF